jgi:hypothetical protein
VLLGDVSGQLGVIDRAVLAFAAGEAFLQVKFGVYEGAIVAQSNLRRVAEKAGVLMLQNVSNASSKVRRYVMFVSEVGRDLRAFHGECIRYPHSVRQQIKSCSSRSTYNWSSDSFSCVAVIIKI